MSTKIRVTAPVWNALRAHHLNPAVGRERMSYAFGSSTVAQDGTRIIVVADNPVLFRDDCYTAQTGGHVALDPIVLNAIFVDFAASDHDVLVNVHDHHFAASNTTFSSIDTHDELAQDQYVRQRFEPMLKAHPEIGKPRHTLNVALVFDQKGCDARYLDGGGQFKRIDRIDVVGEVAQRIVPNSSLQLRSVTDDGTLLRQTDIVSQECQRYLGETTFGIVGCGGLGSIIAEQLVRIGARRLILIDDDDLELHNLNRWQGGCVADVGEKKVSILGRRLRDLMGVPDMAVDEVPHTVLSDKGEDALKSADVVIGGLDNHLARYFLNRFAVQYAVPYFDAGVNIVPGESTDFHSRYVGVIPGTTACLECTQYALIDHDEVNRALMDDLTSAHRRAAGYIDGRPDIVSSASTYPLNMRAVSTLSTELLNWICGFRPLGTCVLEKWRDGKYQRSDRVNHPEHPDPNCPSCGAVLGAADGAKLPRPPREGQAARLVEDARTIVRASRRSS